MSGESTSGNHYIMPGTWLRNRLPGRKNVGVVARIAEVHESGTVVIYWKPSCTEFISAPMFRERLMSGTWEVDG